MIAKLLKMQLLGDDDDFAPTEKVSKKRHTSDGRPAWMRTLLTSASNWQTIIPKVSTDLREQENIGNLLCTHLHIIV